MPRTTMPCTTIPSTAPPRTQDPRKRRLFLACFFGVAPLLLPAGLYAQKGGAGDVPVGGAAAASGAVDPAARAMARSLPAVRLTGPAPVIDGFLDDEAWTRAPVARDFVQFEPEEGAPPSEDSEVRVLYDDDALYVGFRGWDSDPSAIVGHLTRRDQSSASDRVILVIDSYLDRRTAFLFQLNPAGVKMDLYMYDDVEEDVGWDAVWDGRAQVDELGWTAEFRIPLSQLRFSGAERQDWGINFARHIARRNELSVWSPLSRQDQAIVSRSGTLVGLTELTPRRRVEVLPYTSARVVRVPGDPGDPFHRPTETLGEVGGDLKVGITSNLTLDVTVNPDFGQVEADPGQVNLTAFETFFPERRPFFQEGAGIFGFSVGTGELFYTRRIGRAPQGRVSDGADWESRPAQTRILGAGKLSGKTDSGWSIGVLGALTGAESSRVDRGGLRSVEEIEPRSGYGVFRLQRDFRDGASALGLIATTTNRDGGAADALELRREGYAAGIDARHRFHGNTLEVVGHLLGSRVSGSSAAILATQRSSARYFQRPDAGHLSVDPERTSLSGWAGSLDLHKVGGGPWRFHVGTQLRSPGFEVNDLGFVSRVDVIQQSGLVGYQETRPGNRLRRWNVNVSGRSSWNFDGDRTELAGTVAGSLQTLGNLNLNGEVGIAGSGLSTEVLRGGPALRTEPDGSASLRINTDERPALQVGGNLSVSRRPDGDSWSLNRSVNIRWRPTGWGVVRVAPFYNRRFEDRQWVARVVTAGESHYLVGRMEQATAGVTVRADLAITPDLTLQLYAQPFLSAGSFSDFRRVAAPRALRYGDRFEGVEAVRGEEGYEVGLGGSPATFSDPDFSVRQFRSNAVLRWEYRPGSTLFLVWSQARDGFSEEGELRLRQGLDAFFASAPRNVLMMKMSYWLSP